MRMPWRLILLIVAAVCVLHGCSAMRFAYNYADNYLVGAAQDYFDPTPEQLRAVRAHAETLLEWHRQQELPLYAELAQQAALKSADTLTAEEIAWAIGELQARYGTLAERIIDANVALLANLSTANLAALERKFAENNAKLTREYLDAEPARRDERRIERVQGQLKRWIGPLKPEQGAIVRAWVAAAPDAPSRWLAQRQAHQQNVLALLRAERDAGVLSTQLTALWRSRTERSDYAERLRQLILSIDATLSAEQRARAVSRLRQYAEQFRVLSE